MSHFPNSNLSKYSHACSPTGRMHATLFMGRSKPPSREALLQVMRELPRLPELSGFDLAVVGSLLYAPQRHRDIDILITERWAQFSVESVERALKACIQAGRDAGGVTIDPVFRMRSESKELGGWLAPGKILSGWRLENPGISFRRTAGLSTAYENLSRCMVAERIAASECAFFRKLPAGPGGDLRYLPPPAPLADFLARFG